MIWDLQIGLYYSLVFQSICHIVGTQCCWLLKSFQSALHVFPHLSLYSYLLLKRHNNTEIWFISSWQLAFPYFSRSSCLVETLLQGSWIIALCWRRTQRRWSPSMSPTLRWPSSSAWSLTSMCHWSFCWLTSHLSTVLIPATQLSWVQQVTVTAWSPEADHKTVTDISVGLY